jgi:uncharacterized membrane protein
MKQPPSPRPLRAVMTLILLGATAAPALAGFASRRLDSHQEIFAFADANGDRNIDPGERDRLRLYFTTRSDLKVLDLNKNNDLEREEITALEEAFKTSNTDKRKAKKKKELDKKLEKKRKKNR